MTRHLPNLSDARSFSRTIASITIVLAAACSQDNLPPTAVIPEPTFAKGGIPSVEVTSLANAGPGTLRQAIIDAQAGANVTFADNLCALGSECEIQLSQNTFGYFLRIDKSLQIIGPTAYTLEVYGIVGSGSVFLVDGGAKVLIKNLTISSGTTTGVRGIMNRGTLQLTNSTVKDNVIFDEPGGGIYNSASLTLTNSSVTGNQGFVGGGIFNLFGTVTLINSRVSGNRALSSAVGGGVYSQGSSVAGSLTLQKQSCINNNFSMAGTSNEPWNDINVAFGGFATLSGPNCGVLPH